MRVRDAAAGCEGARGISCRKCEGYRCRDAEGDRYICRESECVGTAAGMLSVCMVYGCRVRGYLRSCRLGLTTTA